MKELSLNILDVAKDYMKAGLFEDALYALSLDRGNSPLIDYYRAYINAQLGRDFAADIEKAEAKETGYCFPCSLEDIAVLEFAIAMLSVLCGVGVAEILFNAYSSLSIKY